jgi:hypothetical protein
VVFSITRNKVYHRLNDTNNVYFSNYTSFSVGGCAIDIKDNKLSGWASSDPFKIPKNSAGEQELVE